MSATMLTPSRAPQAMYFALSGLCVFGGLALGIYYIMLRERTFFDVAGLFEGALLSGGLFWLVGMIAARRRRTVMAATSLRVTTIDGAASKLVNHV